MRFQKENKYWQLRHPIKKGKMIKCSACSQEFYQYPSRIKNNVRNYCSKRCTYDSPYFRSRSSVWMKSLNENEDFRRKIIERSIKARQGIRPWNYKTGASRNRKYVRKAWIDLAKLCYIRDGYNCQECGKHGGKLNAHHIKPWSEYPELAFDLSNLTTLCVSCHRKLHIKLKND